MYNGIFLGLNFQAPIQEQHQVTIVWQKDEPTTVSIQAASQEEAVHKIIADNRQFDDFVTAFALEPGDSRREDDGGKR
jgi:hypothetical protein